MKMLILAGVLALAGCTAPTVVVTGKPQDGLLERCLDMPEGVAGATNESLAEGFLVNREGLRTCKGVVQAIKDHQ